MGECGLRGALLFANSSLPLQIRRRRCLNAGLRDSGGRLSWSGKGALKFALRGSHALVSGRCVLTEPGGPGQRGSNVHQFDQINRGLSGGHYSTPAASACRPATQSAAQRPRSGALPSVPGHRQGLSLVGRTKCSAVQCSAVYRCRAGGQEKPVEARSGSCDRASGRQSQV